MSLSIRVEVFATDPEGHTIDLYSFDPGDGTPAVEQASAVYTHTYAAAGTYTVTVRARDELGAWSDPFSRSYTVSEPAAPEPQPEPTPEPPPEEPAPAGYSVTSPHWPHINTAVIDYQIHHLTTTEEQRNKEYDWTAGHYDFVIGGSERYRERNASIEQMQYITLWFVDSQRWGSKQNADGSWVPTSAGNRWYQHMLNWYAANPQYNIETAFIHDNDGQPISVANRKWTEFYPQTPNWYTHPGDEGFRAYHAARLRERFGIGTPAERGWVFVDEMGGPINDGKNSREYPHDTFPANRTPYSKKYRDDIISFFQEMRAGLGTGKRFCCNASGYTTATQPRDHYLWDVAEHAGAILAEFWAHVSMDVSGKTPKLAPYIDPVLRPNARLIYQGHQSFKNYDAYDPARFPAGNYASRAGRGKVFEYCTYLLARTADHTRMVWCDIGQWDTGILDFFEKNWQKVYEVDIGDPTAAYTNQQITASSGIIYRLMTRQYEKAVVYVRPRRGSTDTLDYSDANAVTIDLPPGERWFFLREDGTIDPTERKTLTLRLAEAAIMLRGSLL